MCWCQWKEDGEQLLILTSVQEMIVRVSGERPCTQSGVSFCRMASDDSQFTYAYSSANFSTNGISYQRVCGGAKGYQKGDTVAFYGVTIFGATVDQSYVSALSITYSSNPRQHIWTFATGHGERYNDIYNCPCSVYGGQSPPSFVGNIYI